MGQILITIGNVCYTILVIVVLAFALLFVGTRFDIFGYEVKVVQSGSMEPAIPTGGIVVVAEQASYGVGDVITFGRDTRDSVPITHRIVEASENEAGSVFTTMGDANEDPDSAPVPLHEVIGKVVLSIPYLGFVIEFARTPLGFGLLVGLPALIIVLDEFANIMWEIHKYRFRKRRGKTGNRMPSRERQPREQARAAQRSTPLRQKYAHRASHQRGENRFDLDLRHYRLKRHSV